MRIRHDVKSGQRFNRLTAVSIASHSPETWLLRCECGTEVVLPSCRFVSGRTKSCGCLLKDKLRERNGSDSSPRKPHKDISDQKFGRLTPVEFVTKKGWICRCDCGKTHGPLESYLLTKGKVKSCGCFNSDVTSERNVATGEERRVPRIDLLGEKFGSLTVVSYARRGQ